MPQFRLKPLPVEAVQWTGENPDEVTRLLQGKGAFRFGYRVDVEAADGTEQARRGDWIVKDAQGDLAVCPADTFDATFEPA